MNRLLPSTARSRRNGFLCCVALFIAIFAVYWPLWRATFINFDDNDYISENPPVAGGLKWTAVKWAFTSFHSSNWHPLTWLSHMLDCTVFGLHPGPMHIENVFFHALNASLLFLLLRRMTGMPGRSFFVAALFAFHPLHVESVAWIAERKDVLSTMFWLLATWQYVTYATQARKRAYWLAFLFMVLGLMSKPMLVTLPAVFLLIDFWPLDRFSEGNIRSLFVEKIPFFCLSVASSVTTSFAQSKAVIKFDELAFHSRWENAIISYIGYIWKALYPWNLAIFYPHRIEFPFYEVALSFVAMVCVTLAAWAARKKTPWFLFGWLWYCGTLVPVIGIMQVGSQAMADRYTYVPLIGLFIAGTGGICELFKRWEIKPGLTTVAGALLICLFAGITRIQTAFWKNNVTLFGHALAVTSKNIVAHINLGAQLIDDGKPEEALGHFIEASEIDPYNPRSYYNAGVALEHMGRNNDAIQNFLVTLAIEPEHKKALRALADTLAKTGRTAEALHYYETLLRLDPENTNVLLIVGNTLVATGNPLAGMKQLREALRVSPTNFDASYSLANALAMEGNTAEAILYYSKAIELKPSLAITHYQLGLVLMDAGHDAQAAQQMRDALAISPNSALALDKLAWILSTSGDSKIRNGKEAVQLATRACELTAQKNPVTMATLSAAYAEDGQFEKAIDEAGKSQALSKTTNNAQLSGLTDNLLRAYRSGQPYREKR